MAETGGFLHGYLANHLAIHRYLISLWVKLDGAKVRTLDGAVVANLTFRSTVLARPSTSGRVEFVAHLLSCELAFVVSLIKGDFKFYGIPSADRGVAPSDGVECACFCRLRDGWCNTLNGILDRVSTLLLSVNLFFLLGFDTCGFTGLVYQTTKSKLCLSGCAECKHGYKCHRQKSVSLFHLLIS